LNIRAGHRRSSQGGQTSDTPQGGAAIPVAGRWLRALADYHLADVSGKSASGRRYGQYGLVRAFARLLADERLAYQADAALLRLVGDYLQHFDLGTAADAHASSLSARTMAGPPSGLEPTASPGQPTS
jgi:hypothetical protein